MKIRLTYRRGAAPVDLEATVDGAVTIGDLASAVAQSDPLHTVDGAQPLTIAVLDSGTPVVLPHDTLVADSQLLSGSTFSLTLQSTHVTPAAGAPAGVLRVLAGPDAGKEFPLASGTNYVGRDSDMDVRLNDPLVSKSHVKVNVGAIVEVIDNNSSNGVVIGGVSVGRAVVRPADQITLGDTVISVEAQTQPSVAPGQAPPTHQFIRRPRISPVFAEESFPAPETPSRQSPQRFPMIALVTPVVLGAVLFAVTRQAASLLFVMLSPVLMVGQWMEGRWSGNRQYRDDVARFRSDLISLVATVRERQAEERVARQLESPGVCVVVEAAVDRGDLLWSRRPDQAGFLQLSLGTGELVSRVQVELPATKPADPGLWKELRTAAAEVRAVSGVPVVGDLSASAIGVAGPGESGASIARALVVQAAALHSPAELAIAAVVGSTTQDRWNWLKWLPHTTQTHAPVAEELLAAGPGAGALLLAALESLLDSRRASRDGGDAAGSAVLLVVEDDTDVDRPRLVALAEQGAPWGIHVLWLAPVLDRLPAACATFVESGENGSARAGFVRAALEVRPLAPDTLTLPEAQRCARSLAPVVDAGAVIDDQSDLPRSVSYRMLAGSAAFDDAGAVVERWVEAESLAARRAPGRRRTTGSLRALIGQSAAGPLVLDLRSQGPHALVGGTTGSGKSELLQTWVLGMAAAHSPERVTFLFVDYKGGAAFGDCVHLPHSVGLVTDLSPHLVRRALVSLDAELKYREHVLNAAKAKDLAEMERAGDPSTPPSLVIVVDEFAALAHDVPEFVDGVVNVAQRGRSLGLHLILATQRPAGVIKDNLRANTNLRVALRMADGDDSTDILGTDQAASFDQSIPGRAAVKTGPTHLVPFQTGYVGGHTSTVSPRPEIVIRELAFGPAAIWEQPVGPVVLDNDGPNDLQRLVMTVSKAAEVADVQPPRKPWLPELPEVVDLSNLETARDDSKLVLGLQDLPERQQQPVVYFEPDRDGNLAIFGTGGSGKSTALRSLAVAAGFTIRGGPVHVYGLDFGARGLTMLEALPHVGSIVSGDDGERVVRLLQKLRRNVEERAARYAGVQAATITEYRRIAGRVDEPRVLLLLDGLAAFRQAYEMGASHGVFELLASIASEGRPVGVHVVLTADRAATMPASLGSLIPRRLVLRIADDNDASLLGVPTDLFSLQSPPGRGYLDDREIQVGVLGGEVSLAVQARSTERLAAAIRRNTSWEEAPPILRLPERVQLGDLPVVVLGQPTLGLEDDSIGPVGMPTDGTFLVAGPPGSGRSTTVATILASVLRAKPDTQAVLLAPARSVVTDLPGWSAVATNHESVAELARSLTETVAAAVPGSWLIVIESPSDFLNEPADLPLQGLVKAARTSGQFVVAEGDTQSLGGFLPLLQALRFSRQGIVLQPDQSDGDMLLRTPFPRLRRSEFVEGRGMLVRGGRSYRVQVAQP